jgi:hypothetical protein
VGAKPSIIAPSDTRQRTRLDCFIRAKEAPWGLTQNVSGSTGSRTLQWPMIDQYRPYMMLNANNFYSASASGKKAGLDRIGLLWTYPLFLLPS